MSTIVSIAQAKLMPKDHKTMPNDMLVVLAVTGDHEAREERVIREIMSTDDIPWEEAYPKFVQIANSNRQGLFLATLPYKTGIFIAVTAAFASIPLIFELNSVMWFNDVFVTSDVPDAKDLETALEVGSWAWNWMEPPLGQISFFLLCLQFARAQMENLGYHPYTSWFKQKRALRICQEYPQYNNDILTAFSVNDDLSEKQLSITTADTSNSKTKTKVE